MMQMRLFVALAFGLLASAVSAQDKTLTFDNATPAKTVHLLNGTSVSIGTTGNLIAKCTLDPANTNNCADIGTGTVSNTNAPTVTILASNFSQPPDNSGLYNPGTTFTITPTVGNSPTICWQRTTVGTPAVSGWSSTITTGFNNAVNNIALNTASSNYGFLLECYNLAGGTDSLQINLATNSGAGTGSVFDCSLAPPPAGFARLTSPSTWNDVAGANWPNGDASAVTVVPSYPAIGFSYFGTTLNKYTSLKFHTPATGFNDTSFYIQVTQIPGTLPVSPVPGFKYTMTVSRCIGDFRVNIQNQLDSTDAPACKSVRYNSSGGLLSPPSTIYVTNAAASGANTCALQSDTDYYLNLIMANVTDGIQTNENNCDNNATSCGVMIYVNHQN